MAIDGIIFVPLKPDVVGHIVANSILQLIVISIVTARIVSRIYLGPGLATDDYLMLVATVFSIALLTIAGLLSSAGNGYPIEEVKFNLQVILKLAFSIIPIYISTLLFTKLSILWFYRRLFDRTRMTLLVNCTIVFCIVWGVAHFLANVFICSPVKAQYDLEAAASGACGDQIRLAQSLIITNIVGDLFIMVLPMKTLWRLQMRRTEKFGLMASFMLLGSVIVVGAVRVHYVSSTDLRGDTTGTMPLSLLLICIEPNFGILCVNIPMLRPLYSRWRAKHSSSQLTDHNKYGSNSAGVQLHSFDPPPRKPNKVNMDQGTATLIEQLDLGDAKYIAHVQADDVPSINSEEYSRQQQATHSRGVIGIQRHLEVEISRE